MTSVESRAEEESAADAPKERIGSVQGILKVAVVVFTAITIPFFSHVLQAKTFIEGHWPHERPFQSFAELWKAVVAATVFQLALTVSRVVLKPLLLKLSKDKDETELRDKFAEKALVHLVRTGFNVVSVSWAWIALHDKPWMPWYLGGPADGCFTRMPTSMLVDYSPALVNYMYAELGYHGGNLFDLLFFQERQHNFAEMMLHHVAASMLCFCSIFGNFIQFGAPIAYLHDLSDIPANMSKVLNSLAFKNAQLVPFMCCIFLQALTRLYGLTSLTVFILQSYRLDEACAQFQSYTQVGAMFLLALCALHFFWFSLFMRILYNFAIKGEGEDIQHKIVRRNRQVDHSTGEKQNKMD